MPFVSKTIALCCPNSSFGLWGRYPYFLSAGYLTISQKLWTFYLVNPLTPAPHVTARDEPWPLFLFWRHQFWPKLASSILNFCRRKRSFQWCPDQSDQPNGALDMRKNAKKVEWKTQSKISCHYTWLLRAKNCQFRWCFLRSFLTASKPSRRSITAAKGKEKEEKERRKKKFSKNRKA